MATVARVRRRDEIISPRQRQIGEKTAAAGAALPCQEPSRAAEHRSSCRRHMQKRSPEAARRRGGLLIRYDLI